MVGKAMSPFPGSLRPPGSGLGPLWAVAKMLPQGPKLLSQGVIPVIAFLKWAIQMVYPIVLFKKTM